VCTQHTVRANFRPTEASPGFPFARTGVLCLRRKLDSGARRCDAENTFLVQAVRRCNLDCPAYRRGSRYTSLPTLAVGFGRDHSHFLRVNKNAPAQHFSCTYNSAWLSRYNLGLPSITRDLSRHAHPHIFIFRLGRTELGSDGLAPYPSRFRDAMKRMKAHQTVDRMKTAGTSTFKIDSAGYLPP
jgi:hypothetical protein